MIYHPMLIGSCAAAPHCIMHMATELCALPLANVGKHARVVFRRHSPIPDSMLRNPMLKVCIDSAESKLLLVLLACLLEGVVRKTTIIAMVMLDFMPCSAANCSNASFAFIVLSDEKSCIRCTNYRQEKWSTKMDAARYCLEVSLPFNWAKNPTCVNIM
jgi:hypothetical protein